MSFLMAEMLGLEMHTNRSSLTEITTSDIQTESSGFFTQDAMEDFARKVANKQRNKELEIITVHLEHVLERITNMLSDIGISPELPEARLDPKETSEANTFAFKPPTECLITDPDDDGPNAEEKNKMFGLLDIFGQSSKIRDELLIDLIDWLAIAQNSLENQNARYHDRMIAKRDRDEVESHEGAQEAIQRTVTAIKKLNVIGVAIFGEKVESEVPQGKYSDQLGARLNNNVRRTSVVLDSIPKMVRANAIKNIFMTGHLPDDLHSLHSALNEDDEDEQKLLQDIAKHWKDVGIEIIDIMIDVHELKMIKRSTRLSVRRGLYLFKLIIALLTTRTNEIKTKETLILKLKADYSALKHKYDHMHKDAKNWREKWNEKNSECELVISEKLETQNKLQKLYETYKEKEDEEVEETKERVLTLKSITKNQVSTIEKLEKELEAVLQNQDGLIEKEKLAAFKAKEHANSCEDAMNDMKMKLKATELRFSSFEEILEVKDEELLRTNHQLESVLGELKSKEELIAKLMSSNEDDTEPSDYSKPRKDSINTKSRRGSRRNIPEKKSSKNLPVKSTIKTTTEDNKEVEVKSCTVLPQGGNLLSPQKSQGLIMVESNRLLPKRSRSRLVLSPTAPIESDPTDFKQTSEPELLAPMNETEQKPNRNLLSPTSPVRRKSVAPSTALQRRGSVNVVSTKEYKRVVGELKASESVRNELEIEVEEIRRELENQENKFKALKESSNRQHRLEKLLEEDKLKGDTSKVYTEALKVEEMINKFKMELSHLFEKALFSTASKQAKNAYNFSAPSNPKDFVTSMKLANQRLREGFNKLFESMECAIGTVQQTHRKIMERAENSMGEMTSSHMKSLAKKSKELEDLEKKLEKRVEHYNKLKSKYMTVVNQNQTLTKEVNEIMQLKRKADIELQNYEQEQIKLGQINSQTTETKEELELLLSEYKTNFSHLEQQFEYLETAYDKEKCRREKLEKSILQQNNLQSPLGKDGIGINTKENPTKEVQIGPKTITGRYVNSLNQINDLSKDLLQKKVGFSMLKKAKKATKMWSEAINFRFFDLVKKYLTYCRINEVEKLFVTDLKEPNKEDEDSTSDDHLERFQKILWKLEMFKKKILTSKPVNSAEFDISKSRANLMNVFREVAYSVVAIRKTGNNIAKDLQNKINKDKENGDKNSLQTAPVAPKNSVDSIAIDVDKDNSDRIDTKKVKTDLDQINLEEKTEQVVEEENLSPERRFEHENESESESNDDSVIKTQAIDSLDKTQDLSLNERHSKSSIERTNNESAHFDESNYQRKASNQKIWHSENKSSLDIEIPTDLSTHEEGKWAKHNNNVFSRRNSEDRRRKSTLPSKDYLSLLNGRRGNIRRSSNVRRGSMLDDDSDKVIKWNRRASICPSRSIQKESIHTETPQIPITVEMDIRKDLRSVRQSLRAVMRRNSQAQGKDRLLAEKLSKEALKIRRQSTVAEQKKISSYLGTDVANNSEVSQLTSEVIIDLYKKQQQASSQHNEDEGDTLEETIVESYKAKLDTAVQLQRRPSSTGRLSNKLSNSRQLTRPLSGAIIQKHNVIKSDILGREIITGSDYKVSTNEVSLQNLNLAINLQK